MQYRFFSGHMDECIHQFIGIYGKENVVWAETQREFEKVCEIRENFKVVLLDTFLLRDILTPDNIDKIPSLKQYFTYIVFVGNDILELNEKIKKLK